MASPNNNTQQSGTILLTINSTNNDNFDINEWKESKNIGGLNWSVFLLFISLNNI
jgi:hypothetical protein